MHFSNLPSLPRIEGRSLVVAIVHVPILVIVVCATPVWLIAVMRPATCGEFAFKLLRRLHNWSNDAVGVSKGTRPR